MLDIEELASGELQLFDAVDMAAVGNTVGLYMRGKLVGYLIGKEEYDSLRAGCFVSEDTVVSLAAKLMSLAVVDDVNLEPDTKSILLDDISDVRVMHKLCSTRH